MANEYDPLPYYLDTLSFVDIGVGKDGYSAMRFEVPGEMESAEAVTIPKLDNIPLIIPTAKWLDMDEDDKGELVKSATFHPLCESALCAESPIIDTYRRHAMVTMFKRVSILAYGILEIGSNPELLKRMNAEQINLMTKLVTDPKVKTNEKDIYCPVVKSIEKEVMSKGLLNPTNLISSYIKRGGVFEDADVHRLTTLRSPCLKEFSDVDRSICGSSKLSINTYDNFKQVLTYLLKPVQDGECDHGSNNPTAPYWDSLIKSFVKVQDHLNEIAAVLKEYLPEFKLIHHSTAFKRKDKHFRKMAGLLPVFEHNSGTQITDHGEEPTPTTPANTGFTNSHQMAPTHTPTNNNNGSWSDNNNQPQQQPPQQPMNYNVSPEDAGLAAFTNSNTNQQFSNNFNSSPNQGGWGQPQPTQMGGRPPVNSGFNNGWGGGNGW